MEPLHVVWYLVENNTLMTVSTANASGKPWVSPVSFMYDEKFNLYWVSNKNAVHSKNIRVNPHVAVVIFGPVPPDNDYGGVYIDAEATELEKTAEIEKAIIILSKRKQPAEFTTTSPKDVTGKAAWRIYKAQPKAVFKRADAVDRQSGQAITVREEVLLR